MDYRVIVKDNYKRLPEMRLAVQNLRRRADRARSEAQTITAYNTEYIKVQSGRKPNDHIIDCIATADLCDRQADLIANEVDELNNALENLPEELRAVVQILVIEGRPADDACEIVHVERRSVYNYLDKAIEQLARSLWGVVAS